MSIFWLTGPAWLLACTWIGASILSALNFRSHAFALLAIVGFAFWSIVFAVLLTFRSIWLAPHVCALVLAATFIRARATVSFIHTLPDLRWSVVALLVVFATLQTTLLIGYWKGGNEPTIFWSIFRLTYISPGDSPQSMMQAQYLMFGEGLKRLENFSLFDRPFLGAIFTAGALCAIGRCLGDSFYPHFNSLPLDIAYVSIWIWLNAAVVVGVWLCVARYTAHRALVLTALICASPFFMFNGIGLWPKLLGLHMTIVAALFAIEGRYRIALALTSLSFFCHGSFLWSHLAIAGLIFLFALHNRQANRAFMALGLALVAPALWFIAEKMSGAIVPLRYYYLYDVGVNAALHQPIPSIIEGFYRSTDLLHLSLLPIVNFFRMLMPGEILAAIYNFQIRQPAPDLSDALFHAERNRPVFFAGLVAGCFAIYSAFRMWRVGIDIRLAALVFLMMPLLPAAAFYRRDDYFVTTIQLTAMLPVIMAFAMRYATLSRRSMLAVTAAIMCEQALVYVPRSNNLIYLLAWFLATALVMIIAARAGSDQERFAWTIDLETTRLINAALIASILVLPAVPLLALPFLRDGGMSILLNKR